MGRRLRRAALRTAPALAAAAILLFAAGCSSPDESATLSTLPGALYDPPRPAAAMRLTTGDGMPFDLTNERGNVVLVFFGFTECSDVCPTTLRQWSQVRAALGPDTTNVRFLFVSVDPEQDTPSGAAAYARSFDPSFLGVSGTRPEIDQVSLAWGAAKPGGGRMHSTQVFVVDRRGFLRWGYGRSVTTEEIVRGVRLFARGAGQRSS